MKKEYIKPIIINIKTYNDNALLQTASLYDINNRDPDGNIAGEDDGPITGDGGNIWND